MLDDCRFTDNRLLNGLWCITTTGTLIPIGVTIAQHVTGSSTYRASD